MRGMLALERSIANCAALSSAGTKTARSPAKWQNLAKVSSSLWLGSQPALCSISFLNAGVGGSKSSESRLEKLGSSSFDVELTDLNQFG